VKQQAWLGYLLALLFACASLPADAGQVWLNTKSGVYHCPGTRWFGVTKNGRIEDEVRARAAGYHAAYGNACSVEVVEEATAQIRESFANRQRTAATTPQVWVNTASHVYHCPDTQYYGNTKRGTLMSEVDAVSTGNRPAYGRRCQ